MKKIKYKHLGTGEEETYHVNDKFMISIEELKDKYGSSVSLKEAEKIIWEVTEGGDNAGTTEALSS